MQRALTLLLLILALLACCGGCTQLSGQETASSFVSTAAQSGTVELRFELYSTEKGREALWSAAQH